MIQFAIMMLVLLLGVYYFTIFLHFLGLSVFGKVKINVVFALIPFIYWFKKEKKEIKQPVVKETVVKKTIVEEPVAQKAPVKKKKPVKKTEKK